jgi:uncharacterized protein YkwD
LWQLRKTDRESVQRPINFAPGSSVGVCGGKKTRLETIVTLTSGSKRSTRRRLVVVVALVASILAIASPASAAVITCNGLEATVVGTDGNDTLYGTEGVDVIAGLDGRDRIYGLGGNDIICGGGARDRIFAGRGHDMVFGGDGDDRIKADQGADQIWGEGGDDKISGQTGADVISGGRGDDKISGGFGDDVISGGRGDDILDGADGSDQLLGGAQTDTCDSPNDVITACELPVIAGPSSGDAAYEDESLRIINAERAGHGLAAVARHPELDSYARAWAIEMSTIPLPLTAAGHHSPPFTGSDRPFQNIPNSVSWTAAFENVGYSTIGANETAADVMSRLFYSPGGSGFMTSPGHKCNILETAASEVGLGAFTDSGGALWVVQVYWGTEHPLPTPIAECASVVAR